MHRALTEGSLNPREVRRAVREAMGSMRSAVSGAMPAERENVLRQVVEGMAHAVATSAKAAGDSMRKAAAAGQRLTTSDWSRFAKSMHTLEEDFLSAVGSAGKELQNDSRIYLEHVTRATRRAGTVIAPAARDAASIATRHAPELALETMKAGGRMAAGVAGEFAKGLSGVMSGVAEALRGVSRAETGGTSKRSSRR